MSSLRLPPPVKPPGAACGAAVAAATAFGGAVGLAAGCGLEQAFNSEAIATAAPPWNVATKKRRLETATAAARGCSGRSIDIKTHLPRYPNASPERSGGQGVFFHDIDHP